MTPDLSDRDFRRVQRFILDAAGISLPPAKKALVCGRLAKRLRACAVAGYGDYVALIESGRHPQERQTAIDLLTTNETYFFREPGHFDLLRALAADARRRPARPFRVWSAASSTGEEAFSAAMVLADSLAGRPFEVVGTDISMRVLAAARRGLYPMQRARLLPPEYLRRFCRRGQGEYEGLLLIDLSLRRHVRFEHANLTAGNAAAGEFDVVFLRNVMIYFDGDAKRRALARVAAGLRAGGHLFVGHAESLQQAAGPLLQVAPSVYRKP